MRKLSIVILYIINSITLISSLTFIIYSIVFNDTITIFTKRLPALIMGLPILYMALVSFVRIYRLSNKIKGKDFIFNNFRSKN